MRTKPILLSALLGLASLATASAQVYSINAVGFVNVSVPPGFSMIANPLNATADDTLKTVTAGANIPHNTRFYKFVNGAYQTFTYRTTTTPPGWSGDTSFKPGEGGFISNPGTTAFTLTFVGEVPQGQLSKDIPAGFSIVSSLVPQALPLATAEGGGEGSLGFPIGNNDRIYLYRSGAYQTFTFRTANQWGSAGAPVPNVGEAFWVNKVAAATWNRNFSVN